MNKMRVGIVTLYRGYNYGTSLQAYALKQSINSLGYDAQIIWTDENTQAGRDIRLGKIFRIVRRCIFRPELLKRTFFAYKKSFTSVISDEIKKKFLDFTAYELNVQGMPISQLKKFAADRETIAIVCGSDQIWSAAGANVEPLYFLRFAPKQKRVSYAPSFGSNTVPSYNRKLISKYLKDFSDISVRETQGTEIIKSLIGRDATVVLDPTLLIKWSVPEKRLLNEEYIVAYFLNEPSKIALESLKGAAAKYNCKIVAFPYKHLAYQELENVVYADIGPKEFVNAISGAKCVYTDSFHGTAFSINLHIPFWTFARNYGLAVEQSSRIVSLLQLVGLERQYVVDNTMCDRIPSIDFVVSDRELEKQRKISKEYLLQALKKREQSTVKER